MKPRSGSRGRSRAGVAASRRARALLRLAGAMEAAAVRLEGCEAAWRTLEDRHAALLRRRDVEAAFQAQRVRFDSARLRVFVVESEAAARRLARRLQREPRLARDASALEACTGQRMEWGWFLRDELPEQDASLIFRALPGAIIGPSRAGELHVIYCVEAFRPAVLAPDIEDQLRRELVASRSRQALNPHDPRRFVLS